MIRVASHLGQNGVSGSLLLVEMKENTEWVRIFLAVDGVLPYFLIFAFLSEH